MNKKNLKSKDKVDLKYNLELERKDKNDKSNKGYDFVVREYEWTNIDEQKIKTREIEDKTK